jgi:hypothetical protein
MAPLNRPTDADVGEVVRKGCPIGRRADAHLIEGSGERVAGLDEVVRPVAAAPERLGRVSTSDVEEQEGGVLVVGPIPADIDGRFRLLYSK